MKFIQSELALHKIELKNSRFSIISISHRIFSVKAILFLGEQTLFEVQLLFSRLEINKSSSFSYDSRGTGDESLWVGSEQRWGKGGGVGVGEKK